MTEIALFYLELFCVETAVICSFNFSWFGTHMHMIAVL